MMVTTGIYPAQPNHSNACGSFYIIFQFLPNEPLGTPPIFFLNKKCIALNYRRRLSSSSSLGRQIDIPFEDQELTCETEYH